MKTSFPLLFVLPVLALLFSCSPETPVAERPIRPGPAYIQWLEEQACLRKAAELTSIVSGSSLSWRHGSRISMLPDDAGTWFRASPALTAWAGQKTFLAAFGQKNMAQELAVLGIQGVYFSGMADTGDDWAGRSPESGLGEDATSLSFGRAAGQDEEYEALLAAFSEAELLSGGVLPPAHTGMGPDFFLAVRSVRDYPGLYAMAEIPQPLWSILPDLNEGEKAALSPAATKALASRGVMAPALVQDAPGFAHTPCGWAATGPVTGVDGVKRRWIYRWFETPERPVLHWDDPSGSARRIMEVGLIKQAGLRHQVLVGVHAAAWMGLDAVSSVQFSPSGEALEPGLSALRTLARNAHRYGAALLVEDGLPMEKLVSIQDTGVDFCFDSVLSPSLDKSLLVQDARPVRESLRHSLAIGVDHRALWRGAADGMPCTLTGKIIPLLPEGWRRLLLHGEGEKTLRVNAPTLAAISSGLPPGERPDGELLSTLENAHMLQIATRAFLPGLLMLSGSDLSGGLPQGADWPATPPLWQLDKTPAGRGLPSGLSLYSLPGNEARKKLADILAARAKSGVSRGTLCLVPDCREASVLITASTLPSGGTLVFFGNFSATSAAFTPDFPLWEKTQTKTDLVSDEPFLENTMVLPPWGWSAVLLH